MNPYEEKKQERIERLNDAAQKAEAEAETLSNRAREMASIIPLGQPILVGHHSEKRDRNYRGKIERKQDAAYTAHEKAEYYRERAEAAEKNTSISSDDPDAVPKLEARKEAMQTWLDTMKAINKTIRKLKLTKDTPDLGNRLQEMGLHEDAISSLLQLTLFISKVGYPAYALSNLSANIRRIQERIDQLQRARTAVTAEETINEVRILDNVEDNRVQVFFPVIPSEDVRQFLKSNGLRFSFTIGAWQRFRSNSALYWAREAAKKYQIGSH